MAIHEVTVRVRLGELREDLHTHVALIDVGDQLQTAKAWISAIRTNRGVKFCLTTKGKDYRTERTVSGVSSLSKRMQHGAGMPVDEEQISVARLGHKMSVFSDLKKGHYYDKSTGSRYWHDRSDMGALHGPFATFLAMADDAIAPYEEESSCTSS
jgi:hypothetical protein